jgi:hypothetical protein
MKTFLKNFFTIKPTRYDITNKRATIGALLIITTQLLDLFTTWYGVTHAGAVEANPLLAPAVNNSLSTFITVKIIGTLILVFYSWKRPKMPYIITAIYSIVVFNNIIIITM